MAERGDRGGGRPRLDRWRSEVEQAPCSRRQVAHEVPAYRPFVPWWISSCQARARRIACPAHQRVIGYRRRVRTAASQPWRLHTEPPREVTGTWRPPRGEAHEVEAAPDATGIFFWSAPPSKRPGARSAPPRFRHCHPRSPGRADDRMAAPRPAGRPWTRAGRGLTLGSLRMSFPSWLLPSRNPKPSRHRDSPRAAVDRAGP